MILVAGGTGRLGRDVVGRLVARELPVRILTRNLEHGRAALGPLAEMVELVVGDVRDPSSLVAGVAGVDTVVAAVQGFGGRDAGGIRAVDRDGNLNLVRAAAAAPVARFLLISIHDASPADALALGRAKAAVERELLATAMTPILVRPTAYMETWATIVGEPILASGRARVFGRGRNPINFVAASDVAAIVEEALVDPLLAGRTIEVVGPEDLSFDTVVERFARALDRPVPIAHVPVAMLRVMAIALRPFRPVLADQIGAAVVLDATDRTGRMSAPGGATIRRGTTTFDEVIRSAIAHARRTEVATART